MKEMLLALLEQMGLFPNFKKYVDPEQPVAEGEKILGEMNDLEKGMYTLMDKKDKECEEIKEKAVDLLLSDKKIGKGVAEKLDKQHSMIHATKDFAQKILWASIRSRVERTEGYDTLGLRKDFKIVESKGEKERGPSIGIISIGMSGRNPFPGFPGF
jgi:hypothetical protein